MAQPAPLGDAVGFVVEPLRPQLVEVRKQPGLQKIGVQSGDSVH